MDCAERYNVIRNILFINGEISVKTTGKSTEKAQGMVEFAIAIPILLMLILGIMEIGRLIFAFNAVSAASREAARFGSAVGGTNGLPRYMDCEEIKATAMRFGGLVGLEEDDILIQYDEGPDTVIVSTTCPPTHPVKLGDRIVVNVRVDYQPILPLLNVPPIPIRADSAHTIIQSIPVN